MLFLLCLYHQLLYILSFYLQVFKVKYFVYFKNFIFISSGFGQGIRRSVAALAQIMGPLWAGASFELQHVYYRFQYYPLFAVPLILFFIISVGATSITTMYYYIFVVFSNIVVQKIGSKYTDCTSNTEKIMTTINQTCIMHITIIIMFLFSLFTKLCNVYTTISIYSHYYANQRELGILMSATVFFNVL